MSETKIEILEDKIRELNRTIIDIRGAMSADERRLREAAVKVWGEDKYGCDTPEWMADEILFLRKRLTSWKAENAKLKAQLKTIESHATTTLETVMPKGT